MSFAHCFFSLNSKHASFSFQSNVFDFMILDIDAYICFFLLLFWVNCSTLIDTC
jgi:hypothetical protein